MSLKSTLITLKSRFTGESANNALSLGGTPAAEWAKKSDIQGYISESGGGNVVGAESSGLYHLAIFSSETGKSLMDGGAFSSSGDADTFVKRDAAGRAQFVDPSAAADAATKNYVDTADAAHAALTIAHGAVSAATASKMVVRDSSGRAQFIDPSAAADAATKNYVDTHAALTTAHGAVSAATASKMVVRDSSGRAQFVDPSAAADAATKNYVDTADAAHAALTIAHGAVSAATASKMVVRDAAGRAQFADPSAAADAATKNYVDTHAALTTAHGAVSTATASKMVVRDSAGRAKFIDPAVAADAATKNYVDTSISTHDDSALVHGVAALAALGSTDATNFPIGTYLFVQTGIATPASRGSLYTIHTTSNAGIYTIVSLGGAGVTQLSGTWRAQGASFAIATAQYVLVCRVS